MARSRSAATRAVFTPDLRSGALSGLGVFTVSKFRDSWGTGNERYGDGYHGMRSELLAPVTVALP
jgi:hypothetical protein